tara:strand:- start:237 stop:419 length:183 start_codon:yes stop_codon:yes gene_type:complete
MDFATLASASFLSREDRRAYLKAMERDAQRYGSDGRTLIGTRATVNGQAVIMTAAGWRRT